MKKILFIVFLLSFYTSSYAQKIGIQAGPNFAFGEYYENIAFGFQAGIIADFIAQEKAFHIGMELNYNQSTLSKTILYTTATNIRFLELPLNLSYHFQFSNTDGNLFILAGPYIGFSLTKNYPMDYGLNFGIGYDAPNQRVTLAYGLGLKDYNYDLYNRYLALTYAIFIF